MWERVRVSGGLCGRGIGRGERGALGFNVRVTSARSARAGDVGSLRGTTQNLAAAVGTAVAGALLVSLLGLSVGRAVVEHPELPPELVAQVDLDSVNFVSNDDLRLVLEGTDATPAQVDAAVVVNEESRLATLRLGLLVLAGVSALAILPASRLPRYKPDEIPDPSPAPASD